jgi:Carboxypeptidase regulatory-like domain
MPRRLFRAALPTLAIVVPQLTARASSLCATVVDATARPLAGATVTVTELTRPDGRHSLTTDPNGRACLDSAREGVYSVEAGLAGFMNVRYYPVRVSAARPAVVAFQLPFSEVTEGGVSLESTLSGTLDAARSPLPPLRICLFARDQATAVACTTTNDLGEYALIVPSDVYRAEVSRQGERLGTTMLDLSSPGYYRNKVSVPTNPSR